MKIKEMIERLSKLNPNLDVIIMDDFVPGGARHIFNKFHLVEVVDHMIYEKGELELPFHPNSVLIG